MSLSGTPSAPPRGHLLAMPVLILNLGLEMIYVLEQRLRAQAIPADKGRRGASLPFPPSQSQRTWW